MTDPALSRLGIIAGGGSLPRLLMEACAEQGIDIFIVGFSDSTDENLLNNKRSLLAKFGQVGKIIKFFQNHDVQDLVMIGALKRPSFSEIIPDLKAAKFLAQNASAIKGDSDLLSALKAFLEKEGFSLHAIQDFVPDLLASEGVLTVSEPSKGDWEDIRYGSDILLQTAALDIGQAVVVQERLVLGLEAIEGTNSLIERCGALKRKGNKGVLVKLCKPQQDTSLDLPTIGIETIQAIQAAGFGGIAVHAEKTLVCDKEALVSYANKHHLYIVGINP